MVSPTSGVRLQHLVHEDPAGLAEPGRVVRQEKVVYEGFYTERAGDGLGVEPPARDHSRTAAATTEVHTPPEAPSAVWVMLVLSTMCPPIRYCSRRSL